MSSPSISSWMLTRIPMVALIRFHATSDMTNTAAPAPTIPMSRAFNCSRPPPKKSPAVCAGGHWDSANNPTANVPHTPLTRCTANAPTGSSIFTLSNPMTASTTITPAISPMMAALMALTNAQGAGVATSPARQPLMVMPRSGLPSNIVETMVAESMAAAAAVLVVTQMRAIASGSAAMVEPGLNPNHPSHRTKQPISASERLCPGIGFAVPSLLYLPYRGPKAMMPARPAQPPIECTWVEPAKSRKPFEASQPPPQIQCPTIG